MFRTRIGSTPVPGRKGADDFLYVEALDALPQLNWLRQQPHEGLVMLTGTSSTLGLVVHVLRYEDESEVVYEGTISKKPLQESVNYFQVYQVFPLERCENIFNLAKQCYDSIPKTKSKA